jgi:hypothetical protein
MANPSSVLTWQHPSFEGSDRKLGDVHERSSVRARNQIMNNRDQFRMAAAGFQCIQPGLMTVLAAQTSGHEFHGLIEWSPHATR